VRRLVAAQFPQWADLDIRPVAADGWDNRTFHLGDAMSARLPSGRRYVAQVEKEQAWLPRLAPHLPLPIPAPLARGAPGEGYPWAWSVNAWLPGRTADAAPAADPEGFARDLAGFLSALHRIDASDGPTAGAHNFHRGGALAVYDAQAREAIAALDGGFDKALTLSIWEEALASEWTWGGVWVHGDIAPRNLLVADGRLSAVIDFGSMGVGDPACDLAIAWSFLDGEGRRAFRAALPLDPPTWARARGWALWKAAILASGVEPGPADDIARARGVLSAVLEHPL
jgi:aminoglycoside phosphotransferase (APT) family kinase protein